jgi:uncharacterized protein (TIGR02646 family)
VIRIRTKPATPPEVLRTKGVKARSALCDAYTRAPEDYDSGTKSFTFNSGLYGHADVKKALIKAQAGKCAFCESKIIHIDYGDVEHFRPKGGWRQRKTDSLQPPGYYWLAYEWSNLFLSCGLCNQKFKANFFPLKSPTRRARRHTDDLSAEAPLLLDPAVDDPEAFISFRAEVPYAVDGNMRGTRTISLLGLKREALAEHRRDVLQTVEMLRIVAESSLPEASEAREALLKMQDDSKEYAGMIRAYLRATPPLTPPRAHRRHPPRSKSSGRRAPTAARTR